MPDKLATRISTALAALILVFVGWQWWQSLVPSTYSAMDMGHVDFGGGEEFAHGDPAAGAQHAAHAAGGAARPIGTTDVSDLTGPAGATAGTPEVRVELTARQETVTLAGGTEHKGYTLNGSTPGPTIRATLGDLVEVRFRNEDVVDGATLHWHGLDVPNAMDGVAGVTQDSVGPGEEFVYRFVADEVGSYWYHSHQVSHEQVRGGLFGALVVHPEGQRREVAAGRDVVALVHSYGGVHTVNGVEGEWRHPAEVGDRVRVRVANTDNNQLAVWVLGAAFRVRAVDGHEVTGPETVEDVALRLGAGARADVEVVVPAGGVRLQLGTTSVVVGEGDPPEGDQPDEQLDLLSYGEPAADAGEAQLRQAAEDDSFDREFRYDIGRRPGFVDGVPGMWWSVNGRLFPDVPMFMVREGDLVRMTIGNHSGDVHPMHLHGHRVTVLSRDGEPVTGSSWQVDSLNVRHGETYEVAFVADNPGVWMDHCHNLPHAQDGMIAHLMYEGVSTEFVVGGEAHNHPE